LATCEARGLEYVTDKTNFQPDLTPRNALRHALSNRYTLDQKNDDTSVSSNELGHKLHEVLGRGYTEGAQQLLAQAADESDQLDEEGETHLQFIVAQLTLYSYFATGCDETSK
jgi:tRNA(Ile)-lysidine synthase TilS/MesJ